MTQRLPSIPQRPYAASDAEADAGTKPIYRPGDSPLPFTRNVRCAAIDVMILTFAARRHAEWLASIGTCPEDVAQIIRADLEAIAGLLTPAAPPPPPVEPAPPQTPAVQPVPPQTPDVGPRSHRPARAKDAPTNLWDATRGDVGQPGETGRNGTQRATVAGKE